MVLTVDHTDRKSLEAFAEALSALTNKKRHELTARLIVADVVKLVDPSTSTDVMDIIRLLPESDRQAAVLTLLNGVGGLAQMLWTSFRLHLESGYCQFDQAAAGGYGRRELLMIASLAADYGITATVAASSQPLADLFRAAMQVPAVSADVATRQDGRDTLLSVTLSNNGMAAVAGYRFTLEAPEGRCFNPCYVGATGSAAFDWRDMGDRGDGRRWNIDIVELSPGIRVSLEFALSAHADADHSTKVSATAA